MVSKLTKKLFGIGLVIALLLGTLPGHSLAQDEEVVCENDVILQAEETLEDVAEKFYGNVYAFPVIVEATNIKAEEDDTYAVIDDAAAVEVGAKLCLPSTEVAQELLNETVYTQVEEDEAATTLVVGLTEDTVTMDPGGAYEFHATTVHYPVYETLTGFAPGEIGEAIPKLAESWTISEDGLTYTFTIEEGHVFSTGNPVTAADVAFSLNRVKNMQGNPAFLLDNVESIEATDEMTVVITQIEPDPSLLAKLAFTSLGVLDAEVAMEHGATDAEDAVETDTAEQWLNNNSIGSGPYMLEKWEPKVEAILVRNPNYGGDPAPIDRVIFRTLSEAAAQKLALEAGDLDIALDISADQVPSMIENPDIAIYEAQSDTVFFLIMNEDPDIGGPLADPVVQDAIRDAIDYEGMRILVGGPATTPVNIMPTHWAYALDAGETPERDLESAMAKLEEAGYADGLTVDLEYPIYSSGGVAVETLAQKVQADLAEAGIVVNLQPADLGPALERYRNGEESFGLWLWGPDFLDPIDRLAFTPEGKVGLRVNWTADRASDALNEAVAQARVATDPAERDAAFTAVQTLMLDESPFAFLVQPGIQVAYSSRIENFVYTGTSLGRIDPYLMNFAPVEADTE